MIQNVPIDNIRVGENPRTFFDDARQKELVASIKAVGLLVPLTVSDPGDGNFALIAGERRLRALKELGEATAPVYVSTTEYHRGARVIENVIRADLHPIEEGRAYLALMTDGPKMLSATALAKQLGIAKTRVIGRTKLAVLPTAIADILIAGSVLNALTDDLVAFTEAFGSEVTERFVESMLTELIELATPSDQDAYEQEKDVHAIFGDFLQAAPDVDIVHLTGQSPIKDAAPSDEALNAMHGIISGSLGKYGRINLVEEDFDAIKAYGALREFKVNDWQDEQYCTSKSFLWDRIQIALERQLKETKETGKGLPTNGRGEVIPGKPVDPVKQAKAEDREPTEAEKKASEQLKADAKAEREQAKALREEAGRRNSALALGVAKAFDKHKLRLTDAKLLVRLIVTGNGLVFGWELLQDKELEGADAGLKARSLREWICRGKSTDEVIGRLMQVIVAAAYADVQSLPPSKRRPLSLDLINDQPELLALAKLAMPEDRFKAMSEAVAARAAETAHQERLWAWRHARTDAGVMYGDYQGLAPSHKLVFDPASEAPVYITDLSFTRVPDDVFEMVALNVSHTGQILLMPDGWTYDSAGSVRELSDEGMVPFRPWEGEPFNRRIPKPVATIATDDEPAPTEDEVDGADTGGSDHQGAVDPNANGHDPEADQINEDLDRQNAAEYADALEEN